MTISSGASKNEETVNLGQISLEKSYITNAADLATDKCKDKFFTNDNFSEDLQAILDPLEDDKSSSSYNLNKILQISYLYKHEKYAELSTLFSNNDPAKNDNPLDNTPAQYESLLTCDWNITKEFLKYAAKKDYDDDLKVDSIEDFLDKADNNANIKQQYLYFNNFSSYLASENFEVENVKTYDSSVVLKVFLK